MTSLPVDMWEKIVGFLKPEVLPIIILSKNWRDDRMYVRISQGVSKEEVKLLLASESQAYCDDRDVSVYYHSFSLNLFCENKSFVEHALALGWSFASECEYHCWKLSVSDHNLNYYGTMVKDKAKVIRRKSRPHSP